MLKRKIFSISEPLDLALKQVSKQQNVSQSELITTALTIYVTLNMWAPEQAKKLNDMIPDNQITIFEELNKRQKHKPAE